MKSRVVLSILIAAAMAFANSNDAKRPPIPTMSDMNQHQGNCKVPEFLVNIPGVMEQDYTSCVNDRFKPSDMLAKVVLSQQVDKSAKLVSIVPAPRFYTRVYKVTYMVGSKKKAMICNDKMTYCMEDKPIVSRER